MKTFLVVLICVLAGVTAEVRHAAKILNVSLREIQECMDENNLDYVDFDKLERVIYQKHVVRQELNEFSIDFGCFMACVLEKSMIMQDDEIQLDKILEVAERNNYRVNDETEEKLCKCVKRANEETDKCNGALTFFTCTVQELK